MNKKRLNLFLAVGIILILSVSLVSASWFGDFWTKITGQATGGYLCNNGQQIGDVDGNGAIQAADSSIVLNIAAGNIDYPSNICCADVSKNGAITSYDASLILNIAAGIVLSPGTCGQTAPTLTCQPTIATISLPNGIVGTYYSTTLQASSSEYDSSSKPCKPYQWYISGGALPSGLSLSSSGVISGTPAGSGGTYTFTTTVTDQAGQLAATGSLSIIITAPEVVQQDSSYVCSDGKKIGDVNGDGVINNADYSIVMDIVVKNIPYPANFCCADVSKDGAITSYDAALISNIAAGTASSPGVCGQTTPSTPTPAVSCSIVNNKITVGDFAAFSLSASPTTGVCTIFYEKTSSGTTGGSFSAPCDAKMQTHQYITSGTYAPKYEISSGGVTATAECGILMVFSETPTVTLTANPTIVDSGKSSILMWSFSGVTSCTKSGSDEWTGTLSIPSGSQIIKPKTATTYKLTCTNPAGSIIKSVTVNIAGGGIITPPLPTAICGNGIKEGSEACDDKNIVNDDGCSTTCQIETGWTCNGQPSVCILTSQCLNIKLCSDYTNSTKCKADVCSVGDKSAPSSIDCTATNIKCGCLWKSNLNTCGFSYSSISSPNAILISLLLTKQEFSRTEKITLK